MNKISTLIPLDKNPIQIVIDRLSELLLFECENQKDLAYKAGADPKQYHFKVINDRFNPYDNFKDDSTPLVSIKESDDSNRTEQSANFGKQHKLLTLHIDCFGVGRAESTEDGHRPADLDAVTDCRRLSALVSAILKADVNENLQLDRRLVNSVALVSEQFFIPEFDGRQMSPVCAKRITLQCNIIDTPPQQDGGLFDEIAVNVRHGKNGEVTLLYTNED